MVIDNVNTVAEELEQQEIDAPGGVLSAQLYEKLLAIYLYQNDLCHAKFLWKRIPQAAKAANPELGSVWAVGRAMWQRDWPNVYITLTSVEWSENVAHIMKMLHSEVRSRALELIARAYTSLSLATLSELLGCPPAEAASVAIERGWTIDGQMVMPVRPPFTTASGTTNEDQIHKLTDFVAFLEN